MSFRGRKFSRTIDTDACYVLELAPLDQSVRGRGIFEFVQAVVVAYCKVDRIEQDKRVGAPSPDLEQCRSDTCSLGLSHSELASLEDSCHCQQWIVRKVLGIQAGILRVQCRTKSWAVECSHYALNPFPGILVLKELKWNTTMSVGRMQ